MSSRMVGAALCVALVAGLVALHHPFGTESNMQMVLRMNSLADAVSVLAELGVHDLERLRLLKDADVDKLVDDKKCSVMTGIRSSRSLAVSSRKTLFFSRPTFSPRPVIAGTRLDKDIIS